MALKRYFTDQEKYGLTTNEIKISEKYLRKYKTAGRIKEPESLKLLEMYLIGNSFTEIQQQFPQYPIAKIILTAALAGWTYDRDKMQHTLRDRVQAKVVKSVVDQVDFLTTLLSVNNAERMEKMRVYIADPENNVKPDLTITSIKDYKDVVEALYKIIAGSTPGSKTKSSPLFNALAPKSSLPAKKANVKEISLDDLVDEE